MRQEDHINENLTLQIPPAPQVGSGIFANALRNHGANLPGVMLEIGEQLSGGKEIPLIYYSLPLEGSYSNPMMQLFDYLVIADPDLFDQIASIAIDRGNVSALFAKPNLLGDSGEVAIPAGEKHSTIRRKASESLSDLPKHASQLKKLILEKIARNADDNKFNLMELIKDASLVYVSSILFGEENVFDDQELKYIKKYTKDLNMRLQLSLGSEIVKYYAGKGPAWIQELFGFSDAEVNEVGKQNEKFRDLLLTKKDDDNPVGLYAQLKDGAIGLDEGSDEITIVGGPHQFTIRRDQFDDLFADMARQAVIEATENLVKTTMFGIDHLLRNPQLFGDIRNGNPGLMAGFIEWNLINNGSAVFTERAIPNTSEYIKKLIDDGYKVVKDSGDKSFVFIQGKNGKSAWVEIGKPLFMPIRHYQHTATMPGGRLLSELTPYDLEDENLRRQAVGVSSTFGKGPRSCIGAKATIEQMKVIFATLVNSVEITTFPQNPKAALHNATLGYDSYMVTARVAVEP